MSRIAAGSPIWIDYTAPDFETAKDFYTHLFGWQFNDAGEEYGHYNMVTVGEATIGGAMDGQLAAAQSGEVPPAGFTVYFASDDIQADTEKAKAAGATVVVDPMPVGPLGTMAILISPSGEGLGLWQPGEFAGHDLPMTPGTSVWFELMSMDFAASTRFYQELFGWDNVRMGEDGRSAGQQDAEDDDAATAPDEGGMEYVTNGAERQATAGICGAKAWFPEGTTSFWRIYFATADADATVKAVQEKGGTVTDGPMDSPFGRVASVVDPFGATFQINQAPAGQGQQG